MRNAECHIFPAWPTNPAARGPLMYRQTHMAPVTQVCSNKLHTTCFSETHININYVILARLSTQLLAYRILSVT